MSLDGIRDTIERSFEDYPCTIGLLAGGLGVAGALSGTPELAALMVPAVGLYGAKCLAKGDPTIPPPGWGRPFLGGQCPQPYTYRIRFALRGGGGFSGEPTLGLFGPVGDVSLFRGVNGFGNPRWRLNVVDLGGARTRDLDLGLNPDAWEFDRDSLVRDDGLPDNCGNVAPFPVPPLPPVNPYPPLPPGCPPGAICIPQYEPIVPVPSPDGGKPTYLPIIVPPVIVPVPVVFPITVPITIAPSLKIGEVNISFDGKLTFNYDTQSAGGKDYTDILNQIKDCACNDDPPNCPSETKNVPYLDSADGCSIKTASITVVPGGLSADVADKLQETASKALDMCRSSPPDQKPEVLIGTGTVPMLATEQFVTGIKPEIRSVRLRITAFSEGDCPAISTYPGAAQRKFGSLGFSLPPAAAGGDYVYVFDRDTYYPIPAHGKEGLIRLLLKAGTSWEVYDTGERL